jgi:hypothetical protein
VLTTPGLEPNPNPRAIGEHIAADATGLTAVPGVWVAGNLTEPAANVLMAGASDATAAGAINADLIAEDTRPAVHVRRQGDFSPALEAQVCEPVTGARRHGL